MKKSFLILTVICVIVFAYYYNRSQNYDTSVSKEDTITYSIKGNLNTERLQKYIDCVANKKKDKINIIEYTTEGDPITTQLKYNGKNIMVSIDSSKDKFGGQDKNKIIYNTISGDNQLKDNLLKYLTDRHIL